MLQKLMTDKCAACSHTRTVHDNNSDSVTNNPCYVRDCVCNDFIEPKEIEVAPMYTVNDLRALLSTYPADAKVFALLGQLVLFAPRGNDSRVIVYTIDTPTGS